MNGALTRADVDRHAHSLTDAVDPDPDHFAANLDVLVGCVNAEASLTEAATVAVGSQLARQARNRIEVDRYVADHAEVEAQPVDRPIFLTGLPRSGTTYFQYLFDQDPSLRMLRTWEGDRPVPPPALDPAAAASRRAASAEWRRATRAATAGKLDAMHLSDVDGPQECLAILDQTFVNPGLLWTMSVPGYLGYLAEQADLQEAYAHHKRVLQLLQTGAEARRWTLKWPCHLLALDAISAVYPDAQFVVTHRDPVQALASNCSLASVLRKGTSASADPDKVGSDMLQLIGRHIDRLVEYDRAEEGAVQPTMVHVDYYALVDRPAEVMEGVFATLGLQWTERVEEAIRSWRADNPPGKRGTHEYALEEYGLDRAEVTAAFSAYIERFDVPSEHGRT